jgi:hypothetical protein
MVLLARGKEGTGASEARYIPTKKGKNGEGWKPTKAILWKR